jgi:DNA-directed RNA polymerase II subunit RPB2
MNADTFNGDEAQKLARDLIDRYFKTTEYPYTRHHIDSYDQFMQKDLVSIVQSHNPVVLLKDLIKGTTNRYKYRIEMYIGGETGTEIEIGTPTISLQNTEEVRILFPNEARLRNLSYTTTVYANIIVKIQFTQVDTEKGILVTKDINPPRDTYQNFPLFKIPVMLHSRYCILNNKPTEFLRQAGECPYDYGGYFIIDGSEKVLVTRQEQAFNTLYITEQPSNPKVSIFASIQCLHPKNRIVKRVAFGYTRARPLQAETKLPLKVATKAEAEEYLKKKNAKKGAMDDTIQVSLPFVRKPIPLFVLFRALGFESDEDILRVIFPDFDSPEAKLLIPKLQPCIVDSYPFTNSFLALQYIKTLTKGFGEAHALDILRNQMFIHMPNDPTSQALFLGECVRKILRVHEKFDKPTDRDDTRNQRCLTSGFLTQMLFSHAYKIWVKQFTKTVDTEYTNNSQTIYKDEAITSMFTTANASTLFIQNQLTESIMRGFKGKWGTGLGEEKAGVLQQLSRLSYCDFISHCRRVILDFDTGMKLTGPRMLHPSQFGYFCTNETPSGASIGITKNLSIMTAISIASNPTNFYQWLRNKGRVYHADDLTDEQRSIFVPVYINNGFFGFHALPILLTQVLKSLKRAGCLPYSTSITFSIRERRVQIFIDGGRPLRPLIWLEKGGKIPIAKLKSLRTWRQLVMGTLPGREQATLDSAEFIDPFADKAEIRLEQYIESLASYTGAIEYIDPYEQNECYIANYPEYVKPESTHMEIHPSTILSIMTSLIPFPHHNQSPRNQLSCSQSKQGISYYATNWQNRFDNSAHVLCYGESPLSKTIYTSYLGDGRMPYGMNCVLAIACWSGYNQEDGIVMNYDAVQRGMFRTIAYRSYEAFEEDDEKTHVKTRFGNPANIPAWKDLKAGLDYTKLDENGIIKVGEYCDENTVIVGAYMMNELGAMTDASVTPQVWTHGQVEKIAITVNNKGLRLIKIRVVQDRIPELGDKFSNRHGQKGTIGALLRGHDLPRTKDGIVPDMIMNPHAIPSRMTIGQNLEQLLGKAGAVTGACGDGTAFMNDGSPEEQFGNLLEKAGFEKYGNEILYNGMTGEQIPAVIFIGPVYGMRLKHMVEDKWQARAKGRREQRTHQPTGGRGNQGGLKIGEMDRDALLGHSMASFFRESFMERSDGSKIPLCTSCGTIPVYNPRIGLAFCPLCSGPVKYIGDRATNLEVLPPMERQKGRIIQVELPYATTVLAKELETYMNIGMRFITSGDTAKLQQLELSGEVTEVFKELPKITYPSFTVPQVSEAPQVTTVTTEELEAFQRDVSALRQAQVNPAVDEDEFGDMPPLERAEGGEEDEGVAVAPIMQPMMQPVIQSEMMQPVMQPVMQPTMQPSMQPAMQPAMQPSMQPMAPMMQPAESQEGGTRDIVMQSPLPNGPKMIVVDTSYSAMSGEGLIPQAQQNVRSFGGFGRPRPLRQAPMMMGGMQQSQPMMPGRTDGDVVLKSSAPVFVNKLG